MTKVLFDPDNIANWRLSDDPTEIADHVDLLAIRAFLDAVDARLGHGTREDAGQFDIDAALAEWERHPGRDWLGMTSADDWDFLSFDREPTQADAAAFWFDQTSGPWWQEANA